MTYTYCLGSRACALEETSVREMLHEMHILTAISHPCLVNLLGANVDRRGTVGNNPQVGV